MKRFSSFLIALLTVYSSLLPILPASAAATLLSGDLIKGPGDAVYYYGQNGKRYVFPTLKTYRTWYADFSNVKTVTAGDLAGIMIGGNVTYRPGVKLVKVATDPKVYAVASNGTLRWVETETVAVALYGADWNKKIDDVPDAFFVNYAVGTSIKNASDFSPSGQTASAVDIGADKKLSATPPSPAPTPAEPAATSTASVNPLTFSVSSEIAQGGDIETLLATYEGTGTISRLDLFFDGQLITYCNVISCTGDAIIPQSGTKSSYGAEARATLVDGSVVTSTRDVTITADGSSVVIATVGSPFIKPGQAGSVSVTADSSYIPMRIDIYVDNVNLIACSNYEILCNWSDIINGADGSVHPVYAKMTDYLGRVYTSETKTITLRTKSVPIVTVSPEKTQIYGGETVNVTVTASSNDNAISFIDVLKDGSILKHCTGGAPCTMTSGPWSSGSVLTFTGQASDTAGSVGTATSSDLVSVVAR